MEELTVDNLSKSSASSDNDCNLSSVNSTDYQEYTKDLDYRIACSSSQSLDLIMQNVSSHVSKFASSLNLGKEHTQFTSRVMEIFKDNLQENVTVNGLPYVAGKNFLTPRDNEVLTNEKQEALLSNLSKKVQKVSAKRKQVPKEYGRICKMRLKHEFQNMKKLKVTHNVSIPIVNRKSFQLKSLSSEELEKVSMQLQSKKKELLDKVVEINDAANNADYAQKVLKKQVILCDTGYVSS